MGANMPCELLIEMGSSGLAKVRTGDIISEIYCLYMEVRLGAYNINLAF